MKLSVNRHKEPIQSYDIFALLCEPSAQVRHFAFLGGENPELARSL